jgi:hypothetical protein
MAEQTSRKYAQTSEKLSENIKQNFRSSRGAWQFLSLMGKPKGQPILK